MKVLFAASEASPIAKVGGLGDVAGALPKALKILGVDIRIVIPRYQAIETPGTLPNSEVPVYYVEGDFFNREKIYGYEDDPERFAYFSQALLDLTKEKGFEPDIIHCNDYHTSLVPVLLKTKHKLDPYFSQTKTVLTIHNLANQGLYDPKVLDLIGLKTDSTTNLAWDAEDGNIDPLLQGIAEADFLNTVSPTYAKEILTKDYGDGLEGKLAERQDRLYGILNGIDTESYDPKTDPNLVANFSLENLADRAKNKHALVQELGLQNTSWPIFGLVTRLVAQKGLDLLVESAETLGRLPLNLAILGVGEQKYEDALRQLAEHSPNVKLSLEFNEGKARRIYGGSDFFLVPSRFEPSGLTQMIAMRYGAVPVVRKTGGLADTVLDGQTGLVFEKYDSQDFLIAIKRALDLYNNKEELARLQENGLKKDFSWDKSAQEYVKLYQKVMRLPKEW